VKKEREERMGEMGVVGATSKEYST